MGHDRAFSTLHLPPGQRVARWTEAASDRFVESRFKVQDPDRFVASMLHRDLAELSVTRITSVGHGFKHITRSQRQVARAHEDFFLVSVQLEGSCWIAQGGRETRLAPGQFAIYDTRRPYELLLEEDYQQAVLRIPCSTLQARAPDCATQTAQAIAAASTAARQLIRQVREACSGTGVPHPATAPAMATALLGAVGNGLRGDTGGRAPTPHSRRALLARIKAHVATHLGDPQLTVPGIATAFGLSTSYLHQLFRTEGSTLERWIWAQRLAACERALNDPRAARQTLTQIAYSHGFSDAAHFSRSFQQRYGASPREYRKSAAAALGTGPGTRE